MPSRDAPVNYADTRDYIAWMIAYAPGFKGRYTIAGAFEDLEHGFAQTRSTLKDAERLAVLGQCELLATNAMRAFGSNEDASGFTALQECLELFRSIRRPKRKYARAEDDPGESADDTVDD
jgi:hypothetical protein